MSSAGRKGFCLAPFLTWRGFAWHALRSCFAAPMRAGFARGMMCCGLIKFYSGFRRDMCRMISGKGGTIDAKCCDAGPLL